ncbi:triose-phosphate isomerase [Patescibacteria group bacterium]|nr:triose-phosphate isomerase [Patescibacteria group bacterium]
MPKIIIANWKMKLSVEESLRLASKLNSGLIKSSKQVIVCPDFISLALISAAAFSDYFSLGAQDCAIKKNGALTGEVSPANLKEIGATYVILGHSERRQIQGEDDKIINEKVLAALEAGLKVMLCVGESAKERANKKTKEVILKQLKGALKNVKALKGVEILIAYEPIWAIGSGEAMEAKEAGVVASYIIKEGEKLLGKKPKILYGGSVDEENASLFLKEREISGLLVGGLSLEAEKFLSIC